MKVKITLEPSVWMNGPEVKAIRIAFGEDFYYKYRNFYRAVDVIVTANQLVAYQVIRDQAGGTNLWKQLKVKILDEQNIVVDVRPLCAR